MNSRQKFRILAILSLGMLLIAAIAPPIPQPLEYHRFADQRNYFGIPNFFNVVSNLAFLFAGIAGLTFLLSPRVSSAHMVFHQAVRTLVLCDSVSGRDADGSRLRLLSPGSRQR